ncbi:MAG: NUDIX domain-containing protein [Tannerellaceae bacterium]|jgi:hypothetical protein|nr:NUDIX domain-containing protein [Tannerellaceae bacterium]
MQTTRESKETLYPHVSVDCVLLGIHNECLCVLLTERLNAGTGNTEYKLPGSLIYETEDLDEAACRILNETTGLKRVALKQFRSFGSPQRTANREDVLWLENASKMKIGRIVTVAYLALCKVRKIKISEKYGSARWTPVASLPRLPFDHGEIIAEAVREIRIWLDREPAIVFDYLPPLFTASQLRRTYEIIYNKGIDVRNFHKKINAMEYVAPTEETEQGRPHRSARYYRFDRKEYGRIRAKLNSI